jgi:hypothetical protein
MDYELRLLEKMAAGSSVAGNASVESARITELFTSIALSHKKQALLKRYFRMHREGVQGLIKQLQSQHTLTKRKASLLTTMEGLAAWMDGHLSQYLDAGDNIDDTDIEAQRLNTTLNLQELGVTLRLYIETGIIRVRNQKALTRLMSKWVAIRTRQLQERFSEDHLYNAIHSPSMQGMDRVQELLNLMLRELNKLRREMKNKISRKDDK